MSMIRTVLKVAVPIPQIEQYQRFLFVGPHPDDIEIGAGATAAKLAAMGKDICFLVCLDGRFGDGNAPEGIREDSLVALRKQEALASAAMLGVKNVRFLELCDGGFPLSTDSVALAGFAKLPGIGYNNPEMNFCAKGRDG